MSDKEIEEAMERPCGPVPNFTAADSPHFEDENSFHKKGYSEVGPGFKITTARSELSRYLSEMRHILSTLIEICDSDDAGDYAGVHALTMSYLLKAIDDIGDIR